MPYISKNIRQLVEQRAGNRCEYCRVHAYLVGFGYHIEHIIGVQHGGNNNILNLAYACSYCNQSSRVDARFEMMLAGFYP